MKISALTIRTYFLKGLSVSSISNWEKGSKGRCTDVSYSYLIPSCIIHAYVALGSMEDMEPGIRNPETAPEPDI